MSTKTVLLSGCTLAVGFAFLVASKLWSADGKPAIVQKQYQGLKVEYFTNSATMSQAFGMNSSSAIIGFYENSEGRQVHFYSDNDRFLEMPIPKGFTNVEAIAISDANIVVGRTMKAVGSEGSLRGIVWQPGQAEIKMLPLPEGDTVSDACDVSADGKRITGYATGSKRLRPVLWQWNETESQWRVEVLPTTHENNPFLLASQLIISPDGSAIVGCCTKRFLDSGTVESHLNAWQQVGGKWTRRVLAEEQMRVKAINNQGLIVGSILNIQTRHPCMVTLEGKFKLLELPADHVGGEARDVNEDSTIVGWSDLGGSEGGPKPCKWTSEGKWAPVNVSDNGYGMLYAINRQGQIAGTAEFVAKPGTAGSAEEAAMLAVRISKDQ